MLSPILSGKLWSHYADTPIWVPGTDEYTGQLRESTISMDIPAFVHLWIQTLTVPCDLFNSPSKANRETNKSFVEKAEEEDGSNNDATDQAESPTRSEESVDIGHKDWT